MMADGRDETIKRIRDALKKRSGKTWSVTGGRGTAWGWLTIDAPPARRTWRHEATGERDDRFNDVYREVDGGPGYAGHMSPGERAELATLLGLDQPVHFQGQSIASSNDYYREYVDRAEGRKPAKCAEPYWD